VCGNDQSQAVKRASGVHIVPNWGEMVARIRARSSTNISVVLDRIERDGSGDASGNEEIATTGKTAAGKRRSEKQWKRGRTREPLVLWPSLEQ